MGYELMAARNKRPTAGAFATRRLCFLERLRKVDYVRSCEDSEEEGVCWRNLGATSLFVCVSLVIRILHLETILNRTIIPYLYAPTTTEVPF